MQDAERRELLYDYSDLIEELEANRDAATDLIPVFRYSDDLVDFMNAYEVTDPNVAVGLLLELQDETAADQQPAGS